jgi:hypothetical protein
MVRRKQLGKNRPWHISMYYSERMRKTTKTSVKMAGNMAEIGTDYFSDAINRKQMN